MTNSFKGTDKNLMCQGYKYELGKEHVEKGEIVMCKTPKLRSPGWKREN